MKIYNIEENDSNQRLDKFLKKLFPNATRSLIYKFNRKNKIKIQSIDTDGKFKKMDNEYKLKTGDIVKIFLSEKDFDLLTTQEKSVSLSKNDSLDRNDIVYEDGDLLVLNKSPGINVHAGDHKTKEANIIMQVHDYLGNSLNSLTFKPSLIHRIDRDTSGILLIGKKKETLTKLVGDFKDHKKVKKIYYAVVIGKLSRTEGTIKKPLKRIEGAKNENKVQVANDGQTAISHYRLLKEHNLKTNEGNIILSEVEVKIDTGRMHQIRVHMASLGNPILGDKAYGDKKINRYFEINYGLTRQALHAWKIDFFHYARNKNFSLEARIKEDLKKLINDIKNS